MFFDVANISDEGLRADVEKEHEKCRRIFDECYEEWCRLFEQHFPKDHVGSCCKLREQRRERSQGFGFLNVGEGCNHLIILAYFVIFGNMTTVSVCLMYDLILMRICGIIIRNKNTSMTDLSLVANPTLQLLAADSAAVQSLSETDQQALVARFAAATPEQQVAYIRILEQEKADTAAMEARQAQEVADAAAQVDQATEELQKAQRQYDTVVRQTLESKSIAEDEQRANDILTQLNSL